MKVTSLSFYMIWNGKNFLVLLHDNKELAWFCFSNLINVYDGSVT